MKLTFTAKCMFICGLLIWFAIIMAFRREYWWALLDLIGAGIWFWLAAKYGGESIDVDPVG